MNKKSGQVLPTVVIMLLNHSLLALVFLSNHIETLLAEFLATLSLNMPFADPLNSKLYGRLELEKKEICLIKLHLDHKVSCELFIVSLQDSPHPQYEALSYVWGNAAETLPIEVNQQEFNVMTNLYSALHHIRLEDGERVLWINAISINQNDMGEQNRQVHLMAEIYACTQGVITCFGQQM